MKINPRLNSGHILLVLIAGVAVVGIVYLGYKVINKLESMPLNPNSQYTNLVEWASERYVPPAVTVTIPEWGVTNLVLPTEVVNRAWYFRIDSSTNLSDWTEVDMEWDDALWQIKTNQNEPARFYRRSLVVY